MPDPRSKLRNVLLLTLAACSALAIACGGDEDDPNDSVLAATPSREAIGPTATPPASATPTATIEPTAEPTAEPTSPPAAATTAQQQPGPPRPGGPGGPGGGPGGPPAQSGTITLVARALAFSTNAITARAGSLRLVVDNRDNLVAHNVSVDGFGVSPDCTGPCMTSLSFNATPGSYRFVCTIHPDMTGTLTVVP